jgi:signal transduction histidine kinase
LGDEAILVSPENIALADYLRSRLPTLCESAALPISMVRWETIGDPRARIDATALDLILRNLLDNAAKYARAGQAGEPPVEVRCTIEGDGVELTVRDHGPGLPRGEERRIFRPFYRINDGFRVDQPGHGLGLAMVRSLVEAHGGRVSVKSKMGEGCVFRAWFPREAGA